MYKRQEKTYLIPYGFRKKFNSDKDENGNPIFMKKGTALTEGAPNPVSYTHLNYEDAVLINEKLVRNYVYTSIHIEEYELESRDTKLGPEDITDVYKRQVCGSAVYAALQNSLQCTEVLIVFGEAQIIYKYYEFKRIARYSVHRCV